MCLYICIYLLRTSGAFVECKPHYYCLHFFFTKYFPILWKNCFITVYFPKQFFKIVFYWLCYYIINRIQLSWVFLFCPLHPAPPLPQAFPTPLLMSMDHARKFFSDSMSDTITLHPPDYSVTTCLYFLITSPLPPHPLPMRQLSICSMYLWVFLCTSCLLSSFSTFNSW